MATSPADRPGPPGRAIGLAAVLAGTGLGLVGWTGLLVPSLIRSIEGDFGQTDAAIGLFFFINATASVGGSMGGGVLTERLGRRVVLPLGVGLLALGLAGMAATADWTVFLAMAVPFGIGLGAIDGGMNGLVLDLYPASRGRALNLLHLMYSLGALASPLVVGRLVEGGTAWQALVAGTAVVTAALAVLLAVVRLPSGRHAAHLHPGASTGRPWLSLPLIALAVAIACYVGAEIGVSDWLVRFLASASLGLATAALALFWGCLALGRLVSAVLGDHYDHARFAALSALLAAIALLAAAVVPSLPVSIVLFGLVGFAFGPVYPLIMAVGGDRYPARAAAVSGFLSGCAVIGAIIYPPVMGFVSVGAGLGAAMAGAAALTLACAIVLGLFSRRSRDAVSPGTVPAAPTSAG
ncbi:MAG TPA: MFS transporter [Candidatus Limnocylindrales bacterium]|nr:MFS transporter [Candidatus Limnocylindrales bacterium]